MENVENVIVVEDKPKKGWGLAALICSIVAFFLNPLSLLAPASMVFGIVALAKNQGKGMGIAGLIVGFCAMTWQIFWDVFWTVLTMGLGIFLFFI